MSKSSAPAPSLPWGSGSSSALAASLPASVEVRAVPFPSSSLLSSFMPTRALPTSADGTVVAPPGAPYQIEVSLSENRRGKDPARLRIVRCTIDGAEVNEQLVLRSSSTARFVGWLEDPTGAKRLKFTFPSEAGKVSAITIGVFDATANGAAGKASVSRPPAAARGASFSGPTVSSESFTLGEPVAAAMLRLRAEER